MSGERKVGDVFSWYEGGLSMKECKQVEWETMRFEVFAEDVFGVGQCLERFPCGVVSGVACPLDEEFVVVWISGRCELGACSGASD